MIYKYELQLEFLITQRNIYLFWKRTIFYKIIEYMQLNRSITGKYKS